MEITGKVIQVLERQQGEGKNGTWLKQEYILETPGQYPKKVCFEMWNDSIIEIYEGQQVTAKIDIESREYNGRWYTGVKAWGVTIEGAQEPAPAPAAPNIDMAPEEGDDLPF